jgi:glucose/mannose-6-phosphate isomerase
MIMKDLINGFAGQLRRGLEIARSNTLARGTREVSNVLICGMGGSGIGGSIVSDLSKRYSKIPVLVCKEYDLPAFVGANSLVVACSYSGNTEETLGTLRLAANAKATIVCVTSGGEMEKFARENQFGLFVVPAGLPPRAAFGYSFVQLVHILTIYGALEPGSLEAVEGSAALIGESSADMKKVAEALANSIAGKIPVIYCDSANEGVAIRFRQQINENGKMLAWHHTVPEMNHNELVGWAGGDERLCPIFLYMEHDHARNRHRMSISRDIMRKHTPNILEVYADGANPIERTLFMVHLCDWVSYHLSILNKVDVMEVKVIDYLKAELAGFS